MRIVEYIQVDSSTWDLLLTCGHRVTRTRCKRRPTDVIAGCHDCLSAAMRQVKARAR